MLHLKSRQIKNWKYGIWIIHTQALTHQTLKWRHEPAAKNKCTNHLTTKHHADIFTTKIKIYSKITLKLQIYNIRSKSFKKTQHRCFFYSQRCPYLATHIFFVMYFIFINKIYLKCMYVVAYVRFLYLKIFSVKSRKV